MSLTITGKLFLSSIIIGVIYFVDLFTIKILEWNLGYGIMGWVFIGNALMFVITVALRFTRDRTWTEDDYWDYESSYVTPEDDEEEEEEEEEDVATFYEDDEENDEEEEEDVATFYEDDQERAFARIYDEEETEDRKINRLLDEKRNLEIELLDTYEEIERSRIIEQIRQIKSELEKLGVS
tara:strand:- start:337 stop:879 length:543 start_codon:yes stop_codon:yes gene_type:complete